GDARGLERERLLAAAAEDERVAALQPDDAPAPATQLDQQVVDLLLRQRMPVRLLARIDSLGFRGREGDDTGVGQAVVHERVAALQQLTAANREQAGIARTGPDQVDRHAATHDRMWSRPSSCQAWAATGTVHPPPSSATRARSASSCSC